MFIYMEKMKRKQNEKWGMSLSLRKTQILFYKKQKPMRRKSMIERYTREEMGTIWSEENRYRAWLEVEVLACEAWAELGEIQQEDAQRSRQNEAFKRERIPGIEQGMRHDVVAFTRSVSESLGEERKCVHYGLTSTDVVDTALSYLMKHANQLIRNDLVAFIDVIKEKAIEH